MHRWLLTFTLCLSALAPGTSAAGLLRVPVAEAGRAAALGARVVETYPSFVLLHADPAAQARLLQAGLDLAEESHGYVLALPYLAPADPQLRAPWQRDLAPPLPAGAVLLQFHGPTQPHWLATLQALDVEVLQYLHPYTYIVVNRGGNVDRAIAALPAVRWAGELPLAARIAPQLRGRSALPTEVRVLRTARSAADATGLRALDATLRGQRPLDHQLVEQQVQLAGTRIEALAGLDGVLSLQTVPTDGGLRGELSNQQLAGNVAGSGLPLPNYPDWLAGLGLSGSGVRMANVDNGVNQSHPDLANRMVPCTGSSCDSSSASLHGTHTAGIMVGDGSSGVRDANGFLRGLGVAPGAQLFEQIYNPTFQQPGGMLQLMRESVQNGALLSNNSWGPSASPRGYDADTRQVDAGVRDADPDQPGDQPLIYVLSIMNGYGGTSSQGSPDEAKNTITVGSTDSQAGPNVLNPLLSGIPLLTWQNISVNSGHGPALDGRRIPHLVAPGCHVDSPTTASSYGLMCGTSMAAPHVSGALALLLQQYRQLYQQLPSPALAKALLIASTVDLDGRSDADGLPLGHRPDSKQGWGRLHLGQLLTQLQRSWIADQATVLTATGQSWSIALQAADPELPVKVVLAYTDAPGHGLCSSNTCTTPAWNNDLDLLVEAGSERFRGNVFDGQGRSQAGGTADPKHNLEAVLLDAGRASTFTVRVEATNISADALPNSSGALQQDFALLCSNCVADAIFADGLE